MRWKQELTSGKANNFGVKQWTPQEKAWRCFGKKTRAVPCGEISKKKEMCCNIGYQTAGKFFG